MKPAMVAAALLVALSFDSAQGATRWPIANGSRFVYAALSNSVAIFATNDRSPRQIGSITTGVGAPGGIFADSKLLYVANNNPVSVTTYVNGQTQPTTTLTAFPNPSYGLGAISAGPDGTIYVATSTGDDGGNQYIYEFARGHSQPSLTLRLEVSGPPVYVAGLAVDNANNLYVNWGAGTSCCGYGLEAFAPGKTHGHFTKFGFSEFGGDVLTTQSGIIAVGVAFDHSRIRIGQLPDPSAHPTRELNLLGNAFALDPVLDFLYVVASDGTLGIYRFSSGKNVGAAPGFSGAHAVAVEPPPSN